MSNSNLKTSALLLSILFTVSACDSEKKFGEMHKSTERMERTTKEMSNETMEMNKTTKKMSEQTQKMVEITSQMSSTHALLLDIMKDMNQKMGNMEGTTQEMSEVTDELYHVAKHGSSMQLRREGLNAIRDTKIFSRKIAEAMKYFMGYEFQIWMGAGEDDQLKREQLMELGLMEFFAEIEEFSASGMDNVEPFKLGEIYENQSFMALAIGMEAIDQRQVFAIKRDPSLKPITMLSLVKEALTISKRIKSGEGRLNDYPGWVRVVMDNEAMALKVLNARANAYVLMFVGRASGIQYDRGEQIKTVMLKRAWDLDLTNMNPATLSEYARYLREARLTQEFLRDYYSAKKKQVLNDQLLKILNKCQVQVSISSLADTQKRSSEVEFLEQLKAWRGF